MSERPKNRIVAHSNQLTEARYTLTVAEQRLVTTLLSFISPDDEDFKDYEIKISDFKKIMGIKSNTVYSNIHPVLKKLKSRVIEIPEENEIFGWFSYSKYIDDKGLILMRFDKALKPYLLKLKEQFTKYGVLAIAQFQSFYTIRIYMLLKQYEYIGHREFELSDFRKILDIEDSKYPLFKEFRRNVINQAKKEFEKKNKDTGAYQSDITFDLETIRTGRMITRLRFTIRKQAYQDVLPLSLPEPEPLAPAVDALIKHGISEGMAKSFVDKQGAESVLRCISLYQEKLKSNKVGDKSGGYLVSMLKAEAGRETEAEKQEKVKSEQKKERAKREQKASELEADYQKEKSEHIEEFLKGLDDSGKNTLRAEFEKSESFVSLAGFMAKAYKDKGLDDPIIKGIFRKFILESYAPDYLQNLEAWKAYRT